MDLMKAFTEKYKKAEPPVVAIGDTVLFNVSSAVPAAAADYDYYYFIIGDTLSDGLTYTNGSISVTIDGEPALPMQLAAFKKAFLADWFEIR